MVCTGSPEKKKKGKIINTKKRKREDTENKENNGFKNEANMR